MHDIKAIRKDLEGYRKKFAKRDYGHIIDAIAELDIQNRQLLTESQELQSQRNQLSKQIGQLMSEKKTTEAEVIKVQVAQIKERSALIETKQGQIAEKLYGYLTETPNILDDEIPTGVDETDNKVLNQHGDIPKFDFTPLEHDILGKNLGMDFETASKVSGSRFVYLKGSLARLERALANFMLDTHITEFSYTEINPPILVKNNALFGTGQLPKFAEDLFQTNEHYLIPTSEVPLTNIVRESILSEAELPLRFAALTPCFRSEAGAAGKDTRGMIRQHQFSKVELVSIVPPAYSAVEQERMLVCVETILQKLGLSYQTLLLCSGDTGFSAQKTIDIEVWLPGQNKYREISSISNCGDFQARRMQARYKDSNGNNHFVHTLNGSGVAVGRCLVAILENYQQSNGSVTVPEVLKPYMGGVEKIEAVS